jgi:hypothetical protein
MKPLCQTGCFTATRDAVPGDNAGLLALTGLCPMEGDIGLCIDRAPDFFALNRLEGTRWHVGIVDDSHDAVIGCVAVAERGAYLHGRPSRVMYAGDLKVHPDHRRLRTADALTSYARNVCRDVCGPDVPILSTILHGNKAMEYRARGQRSMPRLVRFATIRSHSISLLWRRRTSDGAGLTIARGEAVDIGDMSDLWKRIAPGRQFAPVFTTESLASWIEDAPSLGLPDYWLARRSDGGLAGFFALWDQSSFKTTRVTQYSPRLSAVRAAFNCAAPLFRAPPLPRPGEPLRYLTAAHLCVPPEEPGVLRALLIHAYNAYRGGNHSFITIGLDVRDPLSAALHGLMAQSTDVGAYVWTPAGDYAGPALDDRPLHFEIALV